MTNTRTTHRITNLSIPAPDPERHARKCEICHHPDREEIEQCFLIWMRPEHLSRVFKVDGGEAAIRRHAKAVGLYELRRQDTRNIVENVMEHSVIAQTSAADVLRAVELHARLSAGGELREPPPRRIVVERHWDPRNATSAQLSGPESPALPGSAETENEPPDATLKTFLIDAQND